MIKECPKCNEPLEVKENHAWFECGVCAPFKFKASLKEGESK